PNSLRNGTGNFCSHNREFFRHNREFNRASRESAELLSDGGGAGAADIAGDAPELAVERRRSSYSPLLLSPALGQRTGQTCEGEIGRRVAVVQCRHDPG